MKRNRSKLEIVTEAFTEWVGSIPSIVTHSIFFVAVFALVIIKVQLSTILLILTTVVSLEAIYLAIFIQMSVNKQSKHITKHSEHLQKIDKTMSSKKGK